MHIEHFVRMRTQRLHHVGTDRDIGDEMAVHNIDVDPISARGIDRAHFFAKPGEIS